MNRRHFFGMTAAALALAGLPEIVLPKKTIFLPPKFGWHPSALGAGYMREVQQFCIASDFFLFRWDAVGRDIYGDEYQLHVDEPFTMLPSMQAAGGVRSLVDEKAKIAAEVLGAEFKRRGLIAIPPGASARLPLRLPQVDISARYV